MMKQRTTAPSNNKYYIRKATGGLNGAVAGDPTVKGANVLENCVGYANGRFNESINDPNLLGLTLPFRYQLACNAENFIESAKAQGLSISPTPIEGGIMVWQKGATLKGSDGAGHVEFVEAVYDDGTIRCSSSGYRGWVFRTIIRSNANGRWGQDSRYTFRGCIINPSIENPKVVPVPLLLVDGIGGVATVSALQRFLHTEADGVISGQIKSDITKYAPSLAAVQWGKGGSPCVRALQEWVGATIDGYWGKETSKALQKKLGVSVVDGIFGKISMMALQGYLNEHDEADDPTPSNTNKLVEEAKRLAGSASSPTDAYKTALNKAYPNRSSWGAAAKAGKSCDVFVGTVVRSLGLDKDYPRGLKEQYDYKPKNFTRSVYKNVSPYDVSKDGDIVIYKKEDKGGDAKGHTCIRGDGVLYEANNPSKYPHINKDVKGKLDVKRPYVVVLRAK